MWMLTCLTIYSCISSKTDTCVSIDSICAIAFILTRITQAFIDIYEQYNNTTKQTFNWK